MTFRALAPRQRHRKYIYKRVNLYKRDYHVTENTEAKQTFAIF